MLTLTRTGSIACRQCGERAYHKIAAVDTDPFGLVANNPHANSPPSAPLMHPTIIKPQPLAALTLSLPFPTPSNIVPRHTGPQALGARTFSGGGYGPRSAARIHPKRYSPYTALSSFGSEDNENVDPNGNATMATSAFNAPSIISYSNLKSRRAARNHANANSGWTCADKSSGNGSAHKPLRGSYAFVF
jgi:hypothetical protein